VRIGVTILGVFLIIAGIVGYFMTNPVIYVHFWAWKIPIPNPLGLFRPLVYVFLLIAVGVTAYGALSKGNG